MGMEYVDPIQTGIKTFGMLKGIQREDDAEARQKVKDQQDQEYRQNVLTMQQQTHGLAVQKEQREQQTALDAQAGQRLGAIQAGIRQGVLPSDDDLTFAEQTLSKDDFRGLASYVTTSKALKDGMSGIFGQGAPAVGEWRKQLIEALTPLAMADRRQTTDGFTMTGVQDVITTDPKTGGSLPGGAFAVVGRFEKDMGITDQPPQGQTPQGLEVRQLPDGKYQLVQVKHAPLTVNKSPDGNDKIKFYTLPGIMQAVDGNERVATTLLVAAAKRGNKDALEALKDMSSGDAIGGTAGKLIKAGVKPETAVTATMKEPKAGTWRDNVLGADGKPYQVLTDPHTGAELQRVPQYVKPEKGDTSGAREDRRERRQDMRSDREAINKAAADFQKQRTEYRRAAEEYETNRKAGSVTKDDERRIQEQAQDLKDASDNLGRLYAQYQRAYGQEYAPLTSTPKSSRGGMAPSAGPAQQKLANKSTGTAVIQGGRIRVQF